MSIPQHFQHLYIFKNPYFFAHSQSSKLFDLLGFPLPILWAVTINWNMFGNTDLQPIKRILGDSLIFQVKSFD